MRSIPPSMTLALIAGLCELFGCSRNVPRGPELAEETCSAPEPERDEYEVYAAVLAHAAFPRAHEILRSTRTPDGFIDEFDFQAPELERPTDATTEAPELERPTDATTEMNRAVACLQRVPLSAPASKHFHRVYSAQFSRVRFGRSRSIAAVQVEYVCHWNPGVTSGFALFYLNRQRKRWKVVTDGVTTGGHCP